MLKEPARARKRHIASVEYAQPKRGYVRRRCRGARVVWPYFFSLVHRQKRSRYDRKLHKL